MPTPNRAQGAAILLLATTAVMFLTLVSHSWQTLGIGEGGFGPLGVESCADIFSTDCASYWWSDVPLSGPIPVVGVITLVAGVSAFAFALSCAFLAFARRLDGMPTRSAKVLLVPAIAAATTYQILLATRPEVAALNSLGMTNVGYAGVACIVAMCGAWFCVHRLAAHARRVEQPSQPVVMIDPTASPYAGAATPWDGLPHYVPTPSH
jgi:hypothetical protein